MKSEARKKNKREERRHGQALHAPHRMRQENTGGWRLWTKDWKWRIKEGGTVTEKERKWSNSLNHFKKIIPTFLLLISALQWPQLYFYWCCYSISAFATFPSAAHGKQNHCGRFYLTVFLISLLVMGRAACLKYIANACLVLKCNETTMLCAATSTWCALAFSYFHPVPYSRSLLILTNISSPLFNDIAVLQKHRHIL